MLESPRGQQISVANLLPPAFICTIVGSMWSVYLGLHLLPMLQSARATEDIALYNKGLYQSVISQVLAAMFMVCFGRAVLGQPGTVPSDPEWLAGSAGSTSLSTREVKATGDRRFCKWCQKYKPDRCHHCRVCKHCVLKMDHHCPWIMNCVGFGNHKYFFLLVVYAVLNCFYIMFTMNESVQRCVIEETSSTNRFLLVFGLTLAIIMGTLTGAFLCFHTWLMLKGMTTIEFCEKAVSSSTANSAAVSYNLGAYNNLKAVFGPHWWLWLLPISPPEGNGSTFASASTQAATPDGGFYSPANCGTSVREPEWTGNEVAFA
jgi:hypothetical protein